MIADSSLYDFFSSVWQLYQLMDFLMLLDIDLKRIFLEHLDVVRHFSLRRGEQGIALILEGLRLHSCLKAI